MTTRLYLRTLHAGGAPSAGEKSTVLPVNTLGANNASGIHQESLQLFDIRQTPVGSAIIQKASDATTAARDNYLGRWTSRKLDAQTFGTGTWTIALGLAETNANANSFLNLSVYVWNPGGSSVRGFIYDSHTDLGVEWGLTDDGIVATFTGSNVTASDGDVLVVEVWRDATQSMAVAYTQTLSYNGTTAVVDASTSDFGAYLETPSAATLTFQNDDANHPKLRGTAFKNGTVTITVDKPTGTVDNDVLIATGYCRGDSSLTAPGGWTLVREDHTGTASTDKRLYVWSKVAASEGANYAFTQGGDTTFNCYIIVSTFYQVDTTTPVDVTSTNTGNSASPSSTDLTSTRDNGRLLVGMATEGNSYTAYPSTLDEMSVTDFTSASTVDHNVWDKFLTTAAATGTFSWTMGTSATWVVTSIVIQPVAPVAPTAAYAWPALTIRNNRRILL